MKVLVVNSNNELRPNPVVPLGACLAASAAEAAGHETSFLDLAFEKDPGRAMRRAIERTRPEAIGISIRNVDNTDFAIPRFYLSEVKDYAVAPALEALPGRVVLGGAGFSTMPEEILSYTGAPAGVVADGEVAFPEVLSRWSSGRGLEGVPGVARLEGGRVEGAPGPCAPPDLDALPRSRSWKWVDLRRYRAYGGAANLQTKRGCPLRCTYCVYNKVEGAAYRFRAPASVREEIEEMAAHGATDAEFTDSTFNIPLHHAKAVLEELARAKTGVRLHTAGMNPREADEELFDLMKRAGFRTVMISAEAASDGALEGLGKGYTVREVERMVDLVAASGFEAFWYFLFGGPGESDSTAEETLRFMAARIPKRHLVYIGAGIRIQKGAPVEEIARREGVLAPGEGLLEPRFYFSPRVSRDRLLARIREEVLAHPNYLQVQDFQGSNAPLRFARLLRVFRVQRPAWSFVPWLNRFFDRLGRKRR